MQPMMIRGARGGYCGENRYVGVINILDFYLTPGCSIFIEPIDSIQASVRMNWTFSGFFASGGTTKFMDRVAASLGIKPANIKIVSVYEGSVVVDFTVIEDSSKTLAKSGGMDTIQNTLSSKLSDKSIDLGAPILNAQVTKQKASDKVTTQAATGNTNPSTNPYPGNTITITDPILTKIGNPLIVPVTIYNTSVINIVKQEV